MLLDLVPDIHGPILFRRTAKFIQGRDDDQDMGGHPEAVVI